MQLYKMPFVSNYVFNNRGSYNSQPLRRFKNIAVFIVRSLLLPHPVEPRTQPPINF